MPQVGGRARVALPGHQQERTEMTKYKLEYIWLDGYKPVPNLRGKTQLKDYDSFPTLEQLPLWGFDGSSTQQAEGHSSDCVLKPVAVYPDGARTNGVLVMCEVMMPDGSPHPSNMRATILDDPGAWFGFEQEYFFYKDGRPLGFPSTGYPAPQGPYYTGVGYKNVGDIARKMVEEHLDLCLFAGINHEGINAEVAKGQWEFQIFGKGSKKAADEMWTARYLLERLAEKYGVDIQYHCKPLGDTDWNGSGMHANFSTAYLRETGGKAYFEALMEAFKAAKDDHIAVYGPDNHMRLTGKHETAAITDFTYGVADRGASIRVPHKQGLSGRPASQLTRGPLPDRFADPEDDRLRAEGRQTIGCSVVISQTSAQLCFDGADRRSTIV
jgi:glutamine synthetase